ncbi:MAG: 4Fe-4S binding protein, partial [Burkholderiaceae bacterium]|nr:4Fe-4S binding protein [Burkholderiaceae bacterium]
YGNGRRIWCMYLCPANGVFALLAKIAPLHFRVDEAKWKAYQGQPSRVVCPPLVDIQRMKGASDCHACGRCSGYREAVELALRSPAREILAGDDRQPGNAQAATLIFGLLGVGTVAMTWQGSFWFASLQAAVGRSLWSALLSVLQQHAAPWWLLANYPQANTVFSLFDGACLLLALLLGGGLLALAIWGAVWLAARTAADPALSWQRLSLTLVPMAGAGLALGLSLFTVKHLRAEGLVLAWVPFAQAALLIAGSLFSLCLGWRMTVLRPAARRLLTLAVLALPVMAMCAIWTEKLF